MENATKALLIAAGVLIALVIVGAFMLMMSNLTDYQEKSYQSKADAQTTEFNNQYDTYIVEKGDSLYKIANEFNTTVAELMKINNLSSNLLSIGQKLLIPKKESSNEFEYVVKAGDSLYSIANKYNTTVDKIKKLNNLSSNLLSIGQILKLPTQESNTYIVKSGDNLYSIANKYNTTVDEIKKKNNLSSNLLLIGQVLIV